MNDLAGSATSRTADQSVGVNGDSACAPELKNDLAAFALPRAEPWRRRTRTFVCAFLSLAMHGSALAAILMLADQPTELGAVTVPTQAISVEIVASSVLESMQQEESKTDAAAAAADSKAGAEPAEAAEKMEKVKPPDDEPVKKAEKDSGKVASTDTEIKESAPQKSNEVEREPPKPLSDEPAPVVVPEPKITTPQPSESDGEKEAARAREMAEEARERRQHEAEEEQRRIERKHEAKRKEERKEQQRKKVEKGGTTSRATTTAQSHSGRASASAGSILTYASQVRARVASQKPSGAGANGTAVVAFGVTASGGLNYASVSRSSGNAALDRLAVSAVRSAAPFPQPPAGASPSQLRFSIPFHFQ